jgi:hypothetical protein
MFCICTIFVFDLSQQSGLWLTELREPIYLSAHFADPLDLCMDRGMRIKDENVLSLLSK